MRCSWGWVTGRFGPLGLAHEMAQFVGGAGLDNEGFGGGPDGGGVEASCADAVPDGPGGLDLVQLLSGGSFGRVPALRVDLGGRSAVPVPAARSYPDVSSVRATTDFSSGLVSGHMARPFRYRSRPPEETGVLGGRSRRYGVGAVVMGWCGRLCRPGKTAGDSGRGNGRTGIDVGGSGHARGRTGTAAGGRSHSLRRRRAFMRAWTCAAVGCSQWWWGRCGRLAASWA